MVTPNERGFIKTIKERCRVCYTCVRECPAKAIRIVDGQAGVLPERCISCGNCVRVCSQQAKQVVSAVGEVEALLAGPARVAAMIAPTFPAEFPQVDHRVLTGMLRALGFDLVTEVAFGADLVAQQYRELLAAGDRDAGRFISTACPAVISYVEKYFPDLVDSLARIVSPMVAQARVLRQDHGTDLQTVFIGPCIAKKCEAASANILDEVNGVLTFVELQQMFDSRQVTPDAVEPSDFDGPHPGLGALFPISRGLLQAADVTEDLMAGEVVATDGNENLVEAIKEFADGALNTRLLEVLCCKGCIMGAGMADRAPLFTRRSRVSQYVRRRVRAMNLKQWQEDMARFAELDLTRRFTPNDQRMAVPFEEEIRMIMARMGKHEPQDELNCGACGYETCVEHAVAIFKGLAESEMCLPHTIDQLRTTIQELAVSNQQLADTQQALVQSEKLASMGQLAAGIAHEVNNPLGVVLMYAHLMLDEVEKYPDLQGDLNMVAEQADRCKKIVSGLLHFARQNKVVLQRVNLEAFLKTALNSVPQAGQVERRLEVQAGKLDVELDPDQVTQVVTNLVGNAQAALAGAGVVTIRAGGDAERVWFSVSDDGCGIPEENRTKIFEPFFTTKQIGEGTGLGLAVTYGIVKMHMGDIRVESNADPATGPTGSTFTVTLPRKGRQVAKV